MGDGMDSVRRKLSEIAEQLGEEFLRVVVCALAVLDPPGIERLPAVAVVVVAAVQKLPPGWLVEWPWAVEDLPYITGMWVTCESPEIYRDIYSTSLRPLK